jgi:hypothetical protein
LQTPPKISKPKAEIVVEKVGLIALACKSNAIRCRLLGTSREVTLRTTVRDEVRITLRQHGRWMLGDGGFMSAHQSKRVNEASRAIDAPTDAIYPLFIDREALLKWLPPKGMSAKILVVHANLDEGCYRGRSRRTPARRREARC